ncbi:MAG: TraR/DksA C4-type zinc finger protein [Thermoanaerobaculales bacterium]|nr:TraR/DksA C4-type zinc finger protein [Thermoanaerobaculales bacterium]
MKRTELNRFEARLLEKREDLTGRVQAARSAETSHGDTETPDLGDRATDAISRELSYELTVSKRDLVRRIDAALDRIADGSFGACVHCNKQVQKARLKAVPWARHCISCQELQDRGEI